MIRVLRHLQVAAVALALASPAPASSAESSAPQLVVIVVVDQFRADYVDSYGSRWTKGLRRLFREGAYFTEAAYPYSHTVTCAGHATIGTGTLPHTHGMVLNGWWDRATKQIVTCTKDAEAPLISYGRAVSGGESAKRLLARTLADVLRVDLTGRVASLSRKARSAIGLAGHAADAIVWADGGAWVTSTAFSDAPLPALQRWIDRNRIFKTHNKKWKRSRKKSQYLYEDEVPEEQPPPGWDTSFSHKLHTKKGQLDTTFWGQWQASPYPDEALLGMAKVLVKDMKLGHGEGTDFLGISFSALDSVGHRFGPRSHEVQDILFRLDDKLGDLLEFLDKKVGRDRYVLAFSADHGVGRIPELARKEGVDAGRVDLWGMWQAVEAMLDEHWGPGDYVATVAYTDMYLHPGVYDRLKGDAEALQMVREKILAQPGAAGFYLTEELRDVSTEDPLKRLETLSHHPERSGEIVVTWKPNWIAPGAAATHGTGHEYDRRVPLVLLGPGITAGHYGGEAGPQDIAPTLAYLVGVQLEDADGRVLDQALRRRVDAGQ